MSIDKRFLYVGEKRIPLDDHGQTILRYRRPSRDGERRMYQAFTAASIIQSQHAIANGEKPQVAPEEFKGCYVFFGPSAPGIYDLKPTPMNKYGPGVEIHAAFLDNLLSDGFMRDALPIWLILFTIVMAIMGSSLAMACRNGVHVLGAFALALPIPWAVAIAAFEQGFWWPIITPELAVLSAMVGGLIANYATEGRQRRFIKRTFQYYLSPAVIDQIMQDPSRLKLGGERRELTIFFGDLAGFSSIAERLDAHEVADLLNEYLTEMTSVILEEQGTLDKYIGDAIVAFWNAPLDQPDHALRGCRAAIKCQEILAQKREQWREKTGATLRLRIGLHTGSASVGNFGSSSRFDYTMIGHAANLASRLEVANKFFGTSIMVSQSTWSQVDGALPGREIGLVKVVGIEKPVRVFEPRLTDGQAVDAARFESAVALCGKGLWRDAAAIFAQFPDDGVSRKYAEKLAPFGTMTPGQQPTWDGVWDLTEK